MPIADLPPSIVWKHFATLCAIAHPSKHEAALRERLTHWATGRALDCESDAAGNLLIRKRACAGYESAPTLALQAHLDMVCQANSGVTHDFLTMPITATVDSNWLVAENTTLGADNGIGVALALAALEDETLVHGPLEVLLTVDEEAGMGGAHGLQPGWLKATRMLNLDTEEWGEFYLGCAGGADVNVHAELATVALPPHYRCWSIKVAGLRGGHSGCDIHLPRGNANRLLAQALQALDATLGATVRLMALAGGTARNALPREASALIAMPSSAQSSALETLNALCASWRSALISDNGERQITLRLEAVPAPQDQPTPTLRGLDIEPQRALVQALCSTPYGVRAMSADFAGVVETSNNLGVMSLADGQFSANLMVRSLRDAQTGILAEEIAKVFRATGATVVIDGHYPGWTPDPASPLLALCQQVYRQTFDAESAVQVIHAGLECGIINAKYPGLDTVSFGPTIRGAHAPGERVDIASVARCWTLLKALIGAIAQPG